jgi:hypothetical protein
MDGNGAGITPEKGMTGMAGSGNSGAASARTDQDAINADRGISGFWPRLLVSAVRRMAAGQLTLIGPDGAAEVIAGQEPGPQATLAIRHPRAIRRLLSAAMSALPNPISTAIGRAPIWRR